MNNNTSNAIIWIVFFIGIFTWLSIWSYTAYTNQPKKEDILYKAYSDCRHFTSTPYLKECENILTHIK
jgi:hypothetical protein